jgi:hypothetical protein
MSVPQEGRTALIWAAMNGQTEVVKALIEKSTDVDAKEKVRSKNCVSTEFGANDQRLGMFGAGLLDLVATGRKCPMHCSCALFVTVTN